jgi:hypothetical protein
MIDDDDDDDDDTDDDDDCGAVGRWNENWQLKQKYSETTCSSASLSATNPT